MSKAYGSVEWLEEKFRSAEVDPWGLSWRGFEAVRYEKVLKILKDALAKRRVSPQDLRILDVGCSTGIFTRRLSALGGNVTGIDASETAISRARLQSGEITYKAGSIVDPALEMGNKDVITCLEVIYYVEESAQPAFLSAIGRNLAEDGIFLISSLVGRPPYFTEERLVKLVRDHFYIDSAHFYGCAWTAKVEAFLFGLWNKVYRIRQFLTTADPSAQEELLNSVTRSYHKRESLKKLKAAMERNQVAKAGINAASSLFLKAANGCLKWHWPARWADQVAAIFHLRHTHTILALTKKKSSEKGNESV